MLIMSLVTVMKMKYPFPDGDHPAEEADPHEASHNRYGVPVRKAGCNFGPTPLSLKLARNWLRQNEVDYSNPTILQHSSHFK